eukprot:GEMP01009811.1.p1 GENE.GEMP01009811.1~~GEMP01009811.1.p1  ORF type:complete len:741 (+),score=169.32 GEMP01009811.1:262-2484(+)
MVNGVPSRLECRLRARYEKALREIEAGNLAQKHQASHTAAAVRLRRSSLSKNISSCPNPTMAILRTAEDSSTSLTTDCPPASAPSSDENEPFIEHPRRHRLSINGKRRHQQQQQRGGGVLASVACTGGVLRGTDGASGSATARSVQDYGEHLEYTQLNEYNALAGSVSNAPQDIGLKHSNVVERRSTKPFNTRGESVANRDVSPAQQRPATSNAIPRTVAVVRTRTPSRGGTAEFGMVSMAKNKANSGCTTRVLRGERLNGSNARAIRPYVMKANCTPRSFMRSKSADTTRFQPESSMFNPERRQVTRLATKTVFGTPGRRQGPSSRAQGQSLLGRDTTSDSNTALVATPSRVCTSTSSALSSSVPSPVMTLQAVLPLSEEERAEYGDRWACVDYTKQKLLGRGGSALVWLAHGHYGMVAVKQISKGDLKGKFESSYLSAQSEIRVGELLFNKGEPVLNPGQYPGIHHIVRIFSYLETKKDLWVIQEFGGEPMSRCLFEIKGEFTRNEFRTERIYRVHHKVLMERLKHDASVARNLLSQLLNVLNVFLAINLVHSDLKPDNVLISNAGQPNMLVRVCDFGSAFFFDDPMISNIATPEYMPPEAFKSNQQQRSGLYTRAEQHPWSFDMWSVGTILLEIVHGAPLWLPYKCRIRDERGDLSTIGLLSVNRRDLDKLAIKQKAVVEDLMRVMRSGAGAKSLGSCPLFQTLLSAILRMDPLARASPDECLDHPWIAKFERRGSH